MWDWNSYFLFLSALLVGYYFMSVYDKKPINKGLMYLILGLLPTFLILALRGREVGIDLERYEMHLYRARYLTSDSVFSLLSEPAFKLIELVSYKIGGLQAFILITSAIEYLFLFLAFRILKEKGVAVKLIYIFFYAYIVIRSFNIVRNGLTWACSLCAYAHLLGNTKEDKRKYWIYTIIGLTLHNSAIINVPIYFVCSTLNKARIKGKDIVLFLLIILVSFLLIYFGSSFLVDAFWDITEERYGAEHFEYREEGFGFGNILWRLPFLLLIIFSSPQLKKRFGTIFYPFFGLFIFDMVVVQLRYIAQDFERLAMYTGLGQVILWGMIAMAYKKDLGKMSTYIVFSIGLVYFTYYMYRWGVEGGAGDGIGIMPYKFWWK